jgi:site-specific recombinase XerD
MGEELVPVRKAELVVQEPEQAPPPPAIVQAAGGAARFAWDEYFFGEMPEGHTRTAYLRNVRQFLGWCEKKKVELHRITPGMVGRYLDELKVSRSKKRPKIKASPATKKQHLAAIRRFFDKLVLRHAIILNPATSVRTDRHQVIDGKTLEIGVEPARELLRSIDVATVIGLRDRAAIGIMIYTAARVGAVAKLTMESFDHDGTQWTLRFTEKGGKHREIPVRHNLEQFLLQYLKVAKLENEPKETPLFRTTVRRTKELTANPMTAVDMCRMVKRRMKAAGLPARLSPHSFRVTTITDLLTQGVPLEDVQYLAGHADARTTRLYDRRDKKVTRNIVERISI